MFFYCARAWTFKPLEVNFFGAHICFKSVRKNVQVQLMKLTLIYCQKIAFFQKAHARTFAQFSSKIILSLHAKNQPPTTILSYV